MSDNIDINELVKFVQDKLPDGATVSGLSWDGYNVYGDEKSMQRVRKMFYAEGMAASLQKIIKHERAEAAAGMRLVSLLRTHLIQDIEDKSTEVLLDSMVETFEAVENASRRRAIEDCVEILENHRPAGSDYTTAVIRAIINKIRKLA